MRLARVLGMVGRSCISAGVLTLLFVVYQLWGTGLREAQAQNALEDEFAEMIGDVPSDPISDGEASSTTSTTFGPPPPPPDEGDAVARIRIPDIGVDKIVVEGVTLDDLKRGPGHYPETPMPGQPGNAAIAGHRTTYGAPFNRIDELDNGDEILITTAQGSFRYEVSGQQIVSPDQVEVLNDFGDNRLTLTACHPKYSASQRIVVTATLVGPAAPAPAQPAGGANPGALPGAEGEARGGRSDEAASGQTIDGAGLSGEGASAWPAVLLAAACAFVWIAAWVLGMLWRRWPAYAVCLPLFLVMLFYFFESFSRLLPANY
ncbi:MAG TPA: class E sortase [Acidimicrobiales bacterium]